MKKVKKVKEEKYWTATTQIIPDGEPLDINKVDVIELLVDSNDHLSNLQQAVNLAIKHSKPLIIIRSPGVDRFDIQRALDFMCNAGCDMSYVVEGTKARRYLVRNELFYKVYINKTSAWEHILQLVIARDCGRCVKCGAAGYQVHHKAYKGVLYRELNHLGELELLCIGCHKEEHRL